MVWRSQELSPLLEEEVKKEEEEVKKEEVEDERVLSSSSLEML